jgi:putative oxidoreductase
MLLPMLTGILPWLPTLAAVGLAIIQILAIFTEHLPKKEYNVLPMNIVLLALAVFIAWGRWGLFGG